MKKTVLVVAAVLIAASVVFALRGRNPLWRSRATAPPAPQSVNSEPAPAAAQPSSSQTSRGEVSIDARRQQLIGVRTVSVKRTSLEQTIRTVGTVRYDETRQSDVNVK